MSTNKTAGAGGGRRTVTYVNARGISKDALVTGGSGTSLNLRVQELGGANKIKTGIARRTALGQTDVWF